MKIQTVGLRCRFFAILPRGRHIRIPEPCLAAAATHPGRVESAQVFPLKTAAKRRHESGCSRSEFSGVSSTAPAQTALQVHLSNKARGDDGELTASGAAAATASCSWKAVITQGPWKHRYVVLLAALNLALSPSTAFIFASSTTGCGAELRGQIMSGRRIAALFTTLTHFHLCSTDIRGRMILQNTPRFGALGNYGFEWY